MHSLDHVLHIAAVLLQGKFDAEPHHVKTAVATAKLLLDEVHGAPEAHDVPDEGLAPVDTTKASEGALAPAAQTDLKPDAAKADTPPK